MYRHIRAANSGEIQSGRYRTRVLLTRTTRIDEDTVPYGHAICKGDAHSVRDDEGTLLGWH